MLSRSSSGRFSHPWWPRQELKAVSTSLVPLPVLDVVQYFGTLTSAASASSGSISFRKHVTVNTIEELSRMRIDFRPTDQIYFRLPVVSRNTLRDMMRRQAKLFSASLSLYRIAHVFNLMMSRVDRAMNM